jgi:DNA-binding YbaB/EbfC family protein
VFKDFGGFGSLLRQAQEMGGRVREMGDQLRGRRVTGTAGGGMVEIEVNGLVEVLRCRIDPTLVKQGDGELLEDMVVAATNQAITRAKELHAETVRSISGNLPLPGLDQLLGKFLGTGEGGKEPGDGKSEPKSPAG